MTLSKISEYINFLLSPKKNKRLAFNSIYKLSRWLLPEYRLYWPQLDWLNNKKFSSFLHGYQEEYSLNTHRRWMLSQLQRLTSTVSGDTAECGVYMGCGSSIILLHNQHSALPRHHFIFDSFEGLSTPGQKDGTYWKRGDLSTRGEEAVRMKLSGFEEKTLLRGWIPEAFPAVADRAFSFVHIDVDLYQPTLESIRFFYPRLNNGGVLVCDDYGFTSCEGATKAIDEFLADKPEKMLSLPQGGGFFIKGTPVNGGAFE